MLHQRIYTMVLTNKGLDVLFDERLKVSPGVKFKDARLLGTPLMLVLGKKQHC